MPIGPGSLSLWKWEGTLLKGGGCWESDKDRILGGLKPRKQAWGACFLNLGLESRSYQSLGQENGNRRHGSLESPGRCHGPAGVPRQVASPSQDTSFLTSKVKGVYVWQSSFQLFYSEII